MNDSVHDENQRFAKTAIWLSIIFAAFLIAGIWLVVKSQPRLLTIRVREDAFAGYYDEAFSGIERLMQIDKDIALDAVFSSAEIADYRGDWEMAVHLIDTYINENEIDLSEEKTVRAEELLQQCAYHQAMSLYEQGAYAKASAAAAAIKGYEPAQMLYQLSYQALIASQPTPAPTATPAPTPEPVATPSAPVEEKQTPEITPTPTPAPTITPTPAPEPLGDGSVAVGHHHSVFLRTDGTVLAYGDNTYGQTDVSQWRNVVSIAAGAYHTIGLTADGRVLATGDNTYGQCDVSLYTDVKQIAAGDWDTCMLLQNGQTVTVGFHQYDFAMEVFPVDQIAAGSYGLLVRSQGVNYASHGSMQLENDCERFALSRGYAVGLDENGRTHSTSNLIPEWEEVVAVSAGENAVLALAKDGSVLSCVFDRHLNCTFDFGQPVLALCAGANHYAFVLQDGSIEIRYSNGDVLVPDEKLW